MNCIAKTKLFRFGDKNVDFTSGKMFKNILLFSIPSVIIAIIQFAFDNIGTLVIGQSGAVYQAAVGCSSSIIGFGIGGLIHLANGGGLAIAIAKGKGDEEEQRKIIRSSMAFSFTLGPIISVLGFFLAEPILHALDTPTDCIQWAVLYLRIYFLCAPARLVNNFAMAISRGMGDSNKPLRYMLVAGLSKIIITFVGVVLLKWHVVAIALSTIVADYVAAIWGLMDLKKGFGNVKWRLKETRFYGRETSRILLLGFPTVLGGWSLSFGAIVMQSKINLFPSVASAGGLIASTINQIVFLVATGFTTTVGTFVGQNWGAKQYKRIRRGMGYISAVVMLLVLLITVAVVLFKQQVCGLFSSDSEVLEMAYLRLENDLLHGTFLQPLASLFGMALSAMGFAVWPMITNFISVFINIVWALVIFQLNPTLEFLYLVFPVTAIFTGFADLVITLIILKKVMKKTQAGVSCVASI